MQVMILILFLIILSSCGKSNSNAGLPYEAITPPLTPLAISGKYRAQMKALNPQITTRLKGPAILEQKDDDFHAEVRITGSSPFILQQQNIHQGSCPSQSDDVNGDGFIDIEEARKVLGPVLIPLDSDLSSQAGGENDYPMTDSGGSYTYDTNASFQKLVTDLQGPDTNPNDQVTKLPPGSPVVFEGKVIVIHGAPESMIFPETVATTGDYSVHQSIPVACGTFKEVASSSGGSGGRDPHDDVDDDSDDVVVSDSNENPPVEPTPLPPERAPRPRREEDEDDDHWYDRLRDWWNHTWGH